MDAIRKGMLASGSSAGLQESSKEREEERGRGNEVKRHMGDGGDPSYDSYQ